MGIWWTQSQTSTHSIHSTPSNSIVNERKERRKTSKQERKLKIQNDGTQEKQKSETSEEVLYVFSVSSYSIRFYTSFYVYKNF